MKQGQTLTELAAEVERQANAKMDFVSNTESLRLEPPVVSLDEIADETILRREEARPARTAPVLAVDQPGTGLHGERFDVNRHAHGQIANRLSIPPKYYNRMLADAPELLMTNVNHWFQENPERRLVRTLDGNVRAFLSDSYQRRDNFDLMKALLPVFLDSDGSWEPHSQNVSDSYLYLKVINTAISTSITTPGIDAVDDVVYAGVAVRNSEIGLAKTEIAPLIWWMWCRNGSQSERYSMSKVHLGKRIGGTELEAMYSDETKRLDDDAYFAKAKDVIKYFTDPANFQQLIGEIVATTEDRITGKVEKSVEVLSQNIGLSGDETEGVLRSLIENAPRNGLTRYGMLQAVTAASQDVEDYDRATELERASDKIISFSDDQWRAIAEAA